MKLRLQSFILSFTTACALTSCLFSTASAQTPYTVGILDCCSSADAINPYGDLAGVATSSPSWETSYAFLYTPSGGKINLTLGGSYGWAKAINASDEVTGFSATAGNTPVHAFLYTPSSGMKDLETLGGSFSEGVAINSSGQVAGDSTLPDGTTHHAFLYSGGTMKDLGTLGGNPNESSYVNGINDAGDVVGVSGITNFRPFLYRSGKMTELSVPGPPLAINNFGQIMGYFVTADNFTRVFVYSDGGSVTDLGEAYPWGFNNFSQIVGSAFSGSFPGNSFLYTPGTGMVQVSSLLFPVCDGGQCVPWDHLLDMFDVDGINDAGQIAGAGWQPGIGSPYTVLFSPVTSSFSPFQAKLQITGKGETHFHLRGSFTLGTDSTGLDPLTQNVLLQLGSLPVPIQKGLFKKASNGEYVFQGVVGLAAVDFRIKPVTSTSFSFRVEGRTGTPFRVTNPARYILMIGNNKSMGTLPWK